MQTLCLISHISRQSVYHFDLSSRCWQELCSVLLDILVSLFETKLTYQQMKVQQFSDAYKNRNICLNVLIIKQKLVTG